MAKGQHLRHRSNRAASTADAGASTQNGQKGRSARPQQTKRRCVLCAVRGTFESGTREADNENPVADFFNIPPGSR